MDKKQKQNVFRVLGEEKGHFAGEVWGSSWDAGIHAILKDQHAELRLQVVLTRTSISKSVEQERGTSEGHSE